MCVCVSCGFFSHLINGLTNTMKPQNNIDLAKPKSRAPQIFFGMFLLMKIIEHVCEINCERFNSFSWNLDGHYEI